MQENRVRIIDIAEELGVSTTTVSNVIHGKTKKISDETVKRVQQLLEQRQYVPSMAGILLSQNNSRIVGVVVNDHEKYEGRVLEDAFIASSLNALLYELEKNGYFMMVKATTEWNEIIRFASMWNMDGLVLIGFCDSDYEKLRDNMHIPFVVYDGYFEENSRICNLTIANEEGGYQVGLYLYGLGHRRILCVSDNCVCVDKERMDGCRRGMEDAEVDFWEVPMTQGERIAFYREHLEALRTYTAVFVVSDVYAIELMQFAQANGIQVPKQLSIVGFDNIGLCEKVHPTLTTVGQNPARRAGEAVQALVRLKEGEAVETVIHLPVELIVRESTAALNLS